MRWGTRLAVGCALVLLGSGGCAAASDPSNGGPVGDAGLGSSADWTDSGDDEDDDDNSKADDPYDSTSGGDGDDRSHDDDGSTGDEGDEGDGGSSGGELMDCAHERTCSTGMDLGQVSGDTDSPNITLAGDSAAWVKFYATEDEDGVGGRPMSLRITLSSPGAADFDLFVVQGPASSSDPCDGERLRSTEDGAPDHIDLAWGEAGVANGQDDSSWIAVEIRPKYDECIPGEFWNLTVQGDY